MKERTILLVEDNQNDVALTLRALKKNNIKNEVAVARDGAEALDFLFGNENEDINTLPIFILLDLKLPRISGIEVLQHLRSNLKTKFTPVVILTTSKEEQDVIDSYRFGANSYIRKPVDFNNFIETIRQLGLYWLILNESPPTRVNRL